MARSERSMDQLGSSEVECPNIETINFVFENECRRTLDTPFDSFSHLKTITVSPPHGGFMKASASIFLSIPTSIEVIRLLEFQEPFKNAAQLEGFFADRPSLREVNLAELCIRDRSKADIFRVIAQRCPHLKTISKLYHHHNDCIDYSGVILLESMKELGIPCALLGEMQIVTICERSPLLEAIELKLPFSSNPHLQSAALNALGSLTKLTYLHFSSDYGSVPAPSLVTEFVRKLARNWGASLRHLEFGDMSLSREAIETLANGCPKLRYLYFKLCVGEVEPASIRFLIDCIVAHPSWITQTGETTLVLKICLKCGDGVDAEAFNAGEAALKALAEQAANLPAGVWLHIW